MTNLIEIKPYIHDFIASKLDEAFKDKVYWIGERKNVPNYPYCMLSVIAETKDKRTSHHGYKLIKNPESTFFCLNEPNLNVECLFAFPEDDTSDVLFRQSITTRYKTCTITVGIYNAWVENTYDTNDMDEEKEFAYSQIDLLEGLFEDYPLNSKFSVQSISPIRPLHEVVAGGYLYRFEFDLTIGYNETIVNNKELGRGIVIDLIDTNEANTEIKNGSVYINGRDAIAEDLTDKDYFKTHFEATTEGNDNIEIETI